MTVSVTMMVTRSRSSLNLPPFESLANNNRNVGSVVAKMLLAAMPAAMLALVIECGSISVFIGNHNDD